ncbi:MAG TPA: MFS transporter [Lacisediminihabitans sp.]|nr:MFS transporter [Lacisediminihabitans sp.]HXD61617.1 MFS transporter [Lacisediminihabitans sp.]
MNRLPVNRRGVAVMASAHLADDFYQGVVPALLPFLVAERGYSYAAVAGLTLAATVLSSVAQPAFGWLGDRKARRWMIPVGMLTASVGVSLAGLSTTYVVTWLLIAISGLGIAAFHPEAARAARQASGNSNRAMSIFALGGNLGFALGSLIATPLLLATGLRGTALLIVPAAVMATILIVTLRRVLDGSGTGTKQVARPEGADDWPAFLRLTAVVIVRSVVFFGLVSFIALYFIHDLHANAAEGGAALTVLLVCGAMGTLAGGWMADHWGRLVTIRIGFALTIPAMAGIALSPSWQVAIVFVGVTGLSIFIPFAVFVILGQDYLPHRIGTASGVTVGLAVSVGGLFAPVLGTIGDAIGLQPVLGMLIALPVVALLLTTLLHDPRNGPRHPRPAGDATAQAADEGVI